MAENSASFVKMSKAARITSINKVDLPSTYSMNSDRERLLLDYVSQFETQFLSQFPKRRPLYISPTNEAGVQKFLPTTLRPALLEDPSLCNGVSLAQFVAESVEYEQFPEPTHYPSHAVSPQTTLEWQRGDSVDMSTLLCSLLLGAGYNAYVVVGFADRRLTQQLRIKESCAELQQIQQITNSYLSAVAVDAAFSHRFRPGLFKLQQSYCKEYSDFNEIERVFKPNEWVNLGKMLKEVENFYFRPNLSEMVPTVDINVQEQELLTAAKLAQSTSTSMKNPFGFTQQMILDQRETRNAEFQYVVSGGGQYISKDSLLYGSNLIVAPPTCKEPVIKNKYIKQRTVAPISRYEGMKGMRAKMQKIGARTIDVEAFILDQMKRKNKLDDIVVPGETGQKKRTDEVKLIKDAEEKDQEHLKELCADILEKQRVYCWVYVAPLLDEKLSYNAEQSTDINQLKQSLESPTKVKHGLFIDAVSGRIFTLGNKLFQNVEAIFNNENYFVNLQENREDPLNFDFYNIQMWSICVMTQQMIKIRQQQQSYVNAKVIEEKTLEQVGGQNQFMREFKNTVGELHQGTNLPTKTNQIIEKKLVEMRDQQYQQQLTRPIDVLLKNQEQVSDKQKMFLKRWDSVTPVKVLMSALPTPWPIQTTLNETKLKQNYPLRVRLENEKIEAKLVPEKTYIFRDCFIRMFNRHAQRNGCTFLMTTRPRPVYQSIFDEDGDCIRNVLVAWRVVRYQLFDSRIDKLRLIMTQFEVKHENVVIEVPADKYQKLNDGLELRTKLDETMVELSGVSFPLWCFVGDDKDEWADELIQPVSFASNSHGVASDVQIFQHNFENGRKDQLKSYTFMPSGMRKLNFFENRADSLGQMIIHNDHIVEKYYDMLRLDGLQERIINFSLDEVQTEKENDLELKIPLLDAGEVLDFTCYVKSLQEQFRDLGQITTTINSRRRRFIKAKQYIEDQDLKAIQGQKADDKAPADKDNEYVDLDTFAEIEYALSLAAYQIFCAQKQVFSSNIGSTQNPQYSIQQGTQSLIKRHNAILLQAYNLCPDKEMVIDQKQVSFVQANDTLNQSAVSKSDLVDESRTLDDDGAQQTGAQFWHRGSKILKQQSSKQTTDYLKADISEIVKNKAHLPLPKTLATNNSTLTKNMLTDNEMRKQTITHLAGVKPSYFEPELQTEFVYNDYVAALRRREMPILCQFKTAPFAYAYVAQFSKDPIRIHTLEFDSEKNTIRAVGFNDTASCFVQQTLFEKSIGFAHFTKVFDRTGQLQTAMQLQVNQHIQYLAKLQATQKKPLQVLTKQAMLFQAESVNCGSEEMKTSVLQISDQYVQLSSREKILHQMVSQDVEARVGIVNAIETIIETKVTDLQEGGSLNIYNQQKGQGLQFRPRDLVMARHALANHGLMDRFQLKTEKITIVSKKIDANDPLIAFIPEEYKFEAVLPEFVAKNVYNKAMDAMKNRILERTGHIQSRLQAETEQLKRRNKNLEQLNPDEKEKVMREIKESIFRIQIIEQRTQKHIQDGTERYAKYAQELKKDKRLSLLPLEK